MTQQMFLSLGRPSEPPETVSGFASANFSMMWSISGGMRAIWSEDYLDRIIRPEVPPLTVEDCGRANTERHAYVARYRAWQNSMLREKRGCMKDVEQPGGHIIRDFVLNDGEKPFTERYFARNAKGEVDGRLFSTDIESRIPLVNVDGVVYRAGERGNDRKVILSEIYGTSFFPNERFKLLELIDSPRTWDQLLCHRMLNLRDYGEETERMIREENLSPESRENLLYNLENLRRNSEQ
jgi:hypothetical protein